MSTRDRAARTATRVMAYRIARASGIGALAVFAAGLFASRRPPERIADRPAATAWTRATGKREITVKELAELVQANYPEGSHAVDLARSVLEHIAREEARDGRHA